MLSILPPERPELLDRELAALATFDWLVLTSRNTVEAAWSRLPELGFERPDLRRVRIAAVGPGTERALAARRLRASLVPHRADSHGLLAAMSGVTRGRVLLPQSDLARDLLQEGLKGLGFEVVRVEAYRTTIDAQAVDRAVEAIGSGSVDAIIFFSPSSVTALSNRLGDRSRHPPCFCIGDRTAAACVRAGIPVSGVAASPSPAGVAAALTAALAAGNLAHHLPR